jgi:hypothetical protein
VLVPMFSVPFAPPVDGGGADELAPDPLVSGFVDVGEAPAFPGVGTFGLAAFGEAFWFGAGVGEPRLSYCC